MEKEEINNLLKSANSLVAEMTRCKVSAKRSVKTFVQEYIDNTFAVNQLLEQCGIVPRTCHLLKM